MRPEQILLADKGEEGALQGTVEVTELMGSTEHVHVTAPDGQFVLIIPVVDLEAKGALKAGDSIWFKFEKNATHLSIRCLARTLSSPVHPGPPFGRLRYCRSFCRGHI